VDFGKRILLSLALSWVCSVTLGLLFALVVGDFSPGTLLLPAVAPVTLLGSTIVAIAVSPLAAWSLRTGIRNLWRYVPILWLVLAAYIVLAVPRAGHYGQYGLLVLAALGLVILGIIPPK
jgi:hypothetical protein